MKKHSIKVKLSLAMILILVISNGLLLFIGNFFLEKSFSQQIKQEIQFLTDEAAYTIDAELTATENLIQELANNPMLIDSSYGEKERVKFYQARAKELGFKLFFYVKPNGIGVNLTPEGDVLDLSHTEYFKQSMQGRKYTTNIIKDELTGGKIIIISAPYYKNDKLQGVFAGIKNIDFFSNICANFKWKKSGTLAIFDKNTQIIGHTNQKFVTSHLNILKKSKEDKNYESIGNFFKNLVLKKTRGSGEFFLQGKGKLASFSNINHRGYSVLISIDRDVVFAPISILIKIQIGVSIVILVFSILLMYFKNVSKISLAFKNLKHDIEELASYNLNYETKKDYSNRKDEIGDIYRATVGLKSNLRRIVGDISTYAQKTSETFEKLNNISHRTNKSAHEVSGAFGSLAESATNQAHNTQEAFQDIDAIGRVLEGMVKSLLELSKSVDNVNLKKEEGKQALNDLINITRENREESKSVNGIILETNQSAEAIFKASEMIQAIADQTNLLALNAAIESARAGDAGKGFAVVADEIGKLAENSTKFTEEIVTIIEDLRIKTLSAVETMKNVERKMSEQRSKAEISREKFNDIEDVIEKSNEVVAKVNIFSKDMEKKSNNITDAIQNLSAIAEENASTTEEASATVDAQLELIQSISEESEKLEFISAKLSEEVSSFSLPE